MELASNTLAGTVVFPGKTFSWIKTMGSCSKAKGYLEAPVYVKGKLVDGYGGGVCQVSTTINIAAKAIGLETKAKAHSGRVAYARIEDEATVKRFYKENGHFRLQPENDAMEPIIVNTVDVLGKVVSLFRKI